MSSRIGTCPGSYSGNKIQTRHVDQGVKKRTVFPNALGDQCIVPKASDSAQEKARCWVLRIGYNFVTNKGVNDPEECVLHRVGGVKVASVADGMLRGENGMKGVRPHNPVNFGE
jgi:hypothetical protein